jgi:epoxyqueuosine reductase
MIDYYQLMNDTLKGIDVDHKPSLLLHSCCAPCNAWVVLYLNDYFRLTLYFNNSNIYPYGEYIRRLNELKRFIVEAGLDIVIIEEPYNDQYMKLLHPMRDLPEGQQRCFYCYELRMREAYKFADDHHYDYFTTVMTISRHKNAQVLNQIGARLSKEFNTQYLHSDFKKGEGSRNSSLVSKKYDFYRQTYCGCVFSNKMVDNCTLDYLPNTNIYLYQRKDMFRINTDTRLLGEFMKIKPTDRVLDVGCNNGALLLYAHQYTPTILVGIDVLQEAIDLAKLNMQLNNIENYELMTINVKDYQATPFDVILCNPPYFPVHHTTSVNENIYLASARHLLAIDLEQLLISLKGLLKPAGKLFMVYRYDQLAQVLKAIDKAGLFIIRERTAADQRDQQIKSILLEISNEAQNKTTESVMI